MYNRFNGIIKALSCFTEIALTAIIPLVIWILIAGYVQNKFELGQYVIIIGVILGVATAYVNMYKIFKRISTESSKKDSCTEKKE